MSEKILFPSEASVMKVVDRFAITGDLFQFLNWYCLMTEKINRERRSRDCGVDASGIISAIKQEHEAERRIALTRKLNKRLKKMGLIG